MSHLMKDYSKILSEELWQSDQPRNHGGEAKSCGSLRRFAGSKTINFPKNAGQSSFEGYVPKMIGNHAEAHK